MKKLIASVLLTAALGLPAAANSPNSEDFRQVVVRTTQMVHDSTVRSLAAKHNLNVVNVTWEDTGRYKGSSVGPNISDMTLQVQLKDTDELKCLPVIRHDNFSDKTADIDMEKFFLLVGNEKGQKPRKVSLKQYLGDLRAYMTEPDSWKGKNVSLLADRDTHALVSAQACFLPIPKGGEVEFNPVLFNYQSYEGDPAVLTILATREGTSMTIIDNKRDGFSTGGTWGQRLFFNQAGERASFTGTRISDFVNQGSTGSASQVEAAGQEGLNMVMLIQVPLKQKTPMRIILQEEVDCCAPAPPVVTRNRASDVENAVIGHGEVEGPFTEIDDLDIERDDRFPVRVTVQFYKATSNGVVSTEDIDDISSQIDRVYAQADYVGSLVTGGETDRPTEYSGNKTQPAGWWSAFARRHEQNTGQNWFDVQQLLRELDLVAE